jgi:hypothetical protein
MIAFKRLDIGEIGPPNLGEENNQSLSTNMSHMSHMSGMSMMSALSLSVPEVKRGVVKGSSHVSQLHPKKITELFEGFDDQIDDSPNVEAEPPEPNAEFTK